MSPPWPSPSRWKATCGLPARFRSFAVPGLGREYAGNRAARPDLQGGDAQVDPVLLVAREGHQPEDGDVVEPEIVAAHLATAIAFMGVMIATLAISLHRARGIAALSTALEMSSTLCLIIAPTTIPHERYFR